MAPPAAPVDVHLFQIFYSEATRAECGPGFALLDNSANPRPDWYEYLPMRKYFLHQALDEEAFYGIFSPAFTRKTRLGAAEVRNFVTEQAAQTDVFLFSPQPDMGAFFLNVFEQGATFDPPIVEVTERFLAAAGRRTPPLAQLVMDSRQVVFSNYFVARPAFWREWLALTEALYTLCEGPASPLQAELCAPTTYRQSGAPRKVFILERLASWLLTTQPRWRTRSVNPFERNWSLSRLAQHPHEAVLSDALKMAYREQSHPQFLAAFGQLRERLYQEMTAAAS
jgi:hypothetical protein